MTEPYGYLPNGTQVMLYTITGGGLTAKLIPVGATMVRLYVPDRNGELADVVLGYGDVETYLNDWMNIGATVGRCADRIKGGEFTLNGVSYALAKNNMGNNLHSGPDFYSHRLWQVERHEENAITFRLDSPHGDQGFPGNITIRVTYSLEAPGILRVRYDALSDQDTILNLTNHASFNLAGHQFPEKAIRQELQIFSSRYLVFDEATVPTGEIQEVTGTPMDFREAKPSLYFPATTDHPFLQLLRKFSSTTVSVAYRKGYFSSKMTPPR